MNIKAPKSTTLVDRLMHKQYIQRHLETIENHNHGTLEHSVRVATLATDIGYENNLSEKEVKTLAVAGLLHDLGKCDISNDILEKPGPLDEAERAEVAKHPVYGRGRIKERFLEKVREIVAHHHDHGSHREEIHKTPVKRKKGSVPYYTEVVTAADMFDALASRRSYKKKFSKREIGEIMHREFKGNEKLIEQVLERF